ncbi:MAG: hypothetical protein QXR87_05735 [Candidatus Hadarchaeales archaeon]
MKSSPGKIPKGEVRILPSPVVEELEQKFGFVEAVRTGREALVVRTLKPAPAGTLPNQAGELPAGRDLVFLPEQAERLSSLGLATIRETFRE